MLLMSMASGPSHCSIRDNCSILYCHVINQIGQLDMGNYIQFANFSGVLEIAYSGGSQEGLYFPKSIGDFIKFIDLVLASCIEIKLISIVTCILRLSMFFMTSL